MVLQNIRRDVGKVLNNNFQGVTLKFQARGPKRSFEKNKWSKTGFLVIFHTILGS